MGMPKMNTSTARIGYARVSTADQNPEAQITALEAAGCTMIRTETGSGSSLESRPELGIILDFIHPDETLVVTRIDRLARSLKDLQVIVAKLRERAPISPQPSSPWTPRPLPARRFSTCSASSPSSRPACAASVRLKELPRPGEGASIADDRRRSIWTQSGIELPKGSRRPGSPARWGSRAEPFTRPKARLETMAKPVKAREQSGKIPPHKNVTKHAICSPYALQDVHICSFGPFRPCRRHGQIAAAPHA